MTDITDMTDEQFEKQVSALEQELFEGMHKFNQEISAIKSALNEDFAAADVALREFGEEVASGSDE